MRSVWKLVLFSISFFILWGLPRSASGEVNLALPNIITTTSFLYAKIPTDTDYSDAAEKQQANMRTWQADCDQLREFFAKTIRNATILSATCPPAEIHDCPDFMQSGFCGSIHLTLNLAAPVIRRDDQVTDQNSIGNLLNGDLSQKLSQYWNDQFVLMRWEEPSQHQPTGSDNDNDSYYFTKVQIWSRQ